MLIENQFTQFKLISDFIINCDLIKEGEKYEVYPKNTLIDYKSFIDIVRVLLNPRYDKDKGILNQLISIIESFSPHLIIIDHILVGHHQAEDGLDLALKLRENKIAEPFLFLSRTEQNNIEVYKKYPLIQGIKDWENKGNTGDGFLTKPHFNGYVWPKIVNLIAQSEKKPISDMIKILLEYTCFNGDGFMSELFILFHKIDALKQPSKELENILVDFTSKSHPVYNERKDLFESLKNIQL